MSDTDIFYLNIPLVSHVSRNKLTEKHNGEKQICFFLIKYLLSNFRSQTCHHLTMYKEFLFDFSRINSMQMSPEPGSFKAVTSNTFRRLTLMTTFVSAVVQKVISCGLQQCTCDYRYPIYGECFILYQQVFNPNFIHLLSQRDLGAQFNFP